MFHRGLAYSFKGLVHYRYGGEHGSTQAGWLKGIIAVKKHHERGHSYKEKHFIGAGFPFQRISPLSSWWETWRSAGRRGAGDELRGLHLELKTAEETVRHTGHSLSMRHKRPRPQGHASSKEIRPTPTGPANSASPCGPSLQTHELKAGAIPIPPPHRPTREKSLRTNILLHRQQTERHWAGCGLSKL